MNPAESTAAQRPDLRSLSLAELGEVVKGLGEKAYRAKQLFHWLHQKYAASFEEMTDLPKALRARLGEQFALGTLTTDLAQESADGTIKFRFLTADGKKVESVYMPEEDRKTLCVSSQVGCAMGCAFCMTATMGLVRNLEPGEIVDQVYRVNAELMRRGVPGPRPLTNLVFMGMGEPLHNFENLKKALELLESEEGSNFSHRHLTVSTSGLVPAMEKLGQQTDVKLAISLNATTDAQRGALMPVNKKWDLAALMEACRAFPAKQGRRLTFEYVLLKGVNDSPEDAQRLAKLVKGIDAKVNLIAYNQNPGLPFESVDAAAVEQFREVLVNRGVVAVVRKNRGRDIAAACGQLVAPGRK